MTSRFEVKDDPIRPMHISNRPGLVDGKLSWGRFCVYPAYACDLPALEISKGYTCPLAEKDENNGQTIPKTAT